ncbi:MAG TPA: NINE protein [Ktedonobacterales bacterium]
MNADDRESMLEYLRTRVPAQRQAAVLTAYERAAKNGTAAFMTCYFLGLFGAHRMYLGDWMGGALRLLVPLSLVIVAIAGAIGLVPSLAALVLAGGLLLIGIAWEVLDLTSIDGEVARSNRALVDRLLSESRSSSAVATHQAVPSYPHQTWQPAAALVEEPMPALTPAPSLRPVPEWTAEAPQAPASNQMGEEFSPGHDNAPAALPLGALPSGEWAPDTQTQPLPTAGAAERETETTAPLQAGLPWYMQTERGAVSPDADTSAQRPAAVGAEQEYLTPNVAARVAPTNANRVAAPYVAPPVSPTDVPADVQPVDPPNTPAVTSAAASQPPPSRDPEQTPATGTPTRPLKRIRVKRRIVVDGKVVGEQVIEELVPAEMDTQVAAAALRARLAEMTPEQIASLAQLPPGASIEMREGAKSRD